MPSCNLGKYLNLTFQDVVTDGVVLDAESILSSELEMLRLESISGDGCDPGPKKKRTTLPWTPKRK